MLEENFRAITNDVNTLIKDAQELFQQAAAMSGAKADDMRQRGMLLIETAMTRARELQSSAIADATDAALSADACVKENPWRAVAAAAGLGLLAGIFFRNK